MEPVLSALCTLSILQATLDATTRTPHGASPLAQLVPYQPVNTRRPLYPHESTLLPEIPDIKVSPASTTNTRLFPFLKITPLFVSNAYCSFVVQAHKMLSELGAVWEPEGGITI